MSIYADFWEANRLALKEPHLVLAASTHILLFIRAAISGHAQSLSQFTQWYASYGRGPLDDLKVPIAQSTLQKVQRFREMRLQEIFDAIYRTLELISSPNTVGSPCSRVCVERTMGQLCLPLARTNLLHQKPQSPFLGHSVKQLSDGFQGTRGLNSNNYGDIVLPSQLDGTGLSQACKSPHCQCLTLLHSTIGKVNNQIKNYNWAAE
ncbi:uncharacterized protein F5Z01DRAFT_637819 [Emericellopsis atlantica]|uniref:Uncharacterized protein n=1 Tax=Emericellopsis atlantica TaxID=2614577 RepID=A0A9P7ZK31_9HYPO|nr:uncharacterized protein F5Z01DRAFT_637819 [Emericellopsis atlantica]KAG9253070.1 hypothetical protein F5Z01DRAFT_637819 [Emericellopsis atlantica]